MVKKMKEKPNVKVYTRLRDERGYTNYKVFKLTGVAQQTLSSWERGVYFPKRDKIGKLAELFDVPVETFYSSVDQDEVIGYVTDAFKKMEPAFEVAAGQGRVNDGYGEPCKTFDGHTARVVGDSMYPSLHDGDVVRFVEDSDVSPSDFALVRINGDELTVKHVEWTGEGLWVRAENKDVFKDRFYTVKEIATIPIQVVGKAVEIVSRKL